MISNAVANSSAPAGPVRSGHSGRQSAEAGNSFRDVLDKSSKSEAKPTEKEAGTAEAESRSSATDTSWRNAFEEEQEGQPVDGDTKPASGETSLTGGNIQVRNVASELLVATIEGRQGDGEQAQPGLEKGSANSLSAQSAAPATGAGAEMGAGLPRADEIAGATAILPGRGSVKDGKTAVGLNGADDLTDGTARSPAGKGADVQAGIADSFKTSGRGGPRNAAAASAVNGNTAAALSEQNPLYGKAALPAGPAGVPDGQDRGASSAARVTSDMSGMARRAAVDSAGVVGRPSAEPPAVAVKITGTAEILQGNAETSASRQIADAVAHELEELTPSRLSLTGSTLPGGRAVKTMRLQLNPAELGIVNVRMQSVDGELRVTIQAESDKTARMLNNDADAIRSALRAAGIGGADVVVSANRSDQAQQQHFGVQHRDPSGQQMDAQENRQNASNESRQSYRDSSSNESAQSQARGGDVGDTGTGRGRRIVI